MSGSYGVHDLWAERPGGRIYGQVFDPCDVHGERPFVICSHFFGGSHRDSAVWARLMADAGYGAYAFDYCGATFSSQSTGVSTREMSIRTEETDLECVLDMVRSLPQVDKRHVYLFGQSQGGLISSMVADARPDDVAGLFLLYPGFSVPALMRGRFGDVKNVPETFLMWQPLGKAYAVEAMDYDPYMHMSYGGPVNIWHADNDPVVPITYSERAVATYPNATLEVIRGADHDFSGSDQRHVAQQIARCIAEYTERTSAEKRQASYKAG